MTLDDIIAALDGLPEAERAALSTTAMKATDGLRWLPNVGAQAAAYFCEADELFYGGSAGSGKSDLAIGLALNCHTRALILRRTNKEALGLVERMAEIVGDRDGWSGQQGIWRIDGKTVEIGGCQLEEDRQKYKGLAHDLKVWDEVSDFSESQYIFVNTWCRSAKEGQRCRIVATGNPPTRSAGMWVVKRWAAWLDPNHPHPALPGELRYYTTNDEGVEMEVDGPGPHLVNGERITARSRTFIPGKLEDNPDLARDGQYAATLAALPEELRAAYRDGRFDLGLKDTAYQAIPTAWVRAAQERWHERPPEGIPQCAIGVDASGGGTDPMIIAKRHGGWYDKIVKVPAKEIPMERAGSYCAGIIISHRHDDSTVIIDLGGGYGSAMYEQLHENSIKAVGYKGAESAYGKTKEGKFGFNNVRSAAIWRFREALDPDQPGGSLISLPPSTTLLADLTAPTYEPDSKQIIVESKKKVCERLGRSTDEGDAVIMAWTKGLKQESISGGFKAYNARKIPTVVLGRSAQNASQRRK